MKANEHLPHPTNADSSVPASQRGSSGARRPGRRVVGPVAIAAGAVALSLIAACSTSGGSGDSGAMSPHASAVNGLAYDSARSGMVPSGGSAPAAGVPGDSSQFGGEVKGGLGAIGAAAFGRSQIKTAGIALRSATVGAVVTRVEGIATTQGGFIDSENTQTDTHGVATSSLLTLRVPVDNFDTAVAAVSQLGQLASKKVSTQDVTGRVADVNSRVTSARESIAQLRVLYSHATKLGDIITLESELSQREADLEALEAQQRALTDQTTLATITVQVTRPSKATVTVSHKSNDEGGFIGGIKQGWDALVTTFQSVAHGLGAALPLGLTLLVIVGLAWIAIRRIPRHRVDTSG